MGIYGTVVLEDHVIQFDVDTSTQTGEYSVKDQRTGKTFAIKGVPGKAICGMLALAISWEGEAISPEEWQMAEEIQSPDADLRVIP